MRKRLKAQIKIKQSSDKEFQKSPRLSPEWTLRDTSISTEDKSKIPESPVSARGFGSVCYNALKMQRKGKSDVFHVMKIMWLCRDKPFRTYFILLFTDWTIHQRGAAVLVVCPESEYVGLIRIICIRYGMACRIFNEIIQSWWFDTPFHLFSNHLNSPCNVEVSGADTGKCSMCMQVSKEQLNPTEEISTQLSASSAASAWQNLPNHTGPPRMQEASLTWFS